MNFAAGHSLLRAAPAARARRDYSRARNVLGRRGAHEFGARSKGLRCICRPSLSAFSTQAGPFLPSRGFQSPTATACATPSLRGRSFIRFPLRSLRGGSAVRSHIAGFLGLLPGTVENIVRERHKNDDRYAAKIDAGWIRFLELEIKDAMAELDAARSCADRMDSPEICAAVAALKTRIAEAEKIVGG